MLKNKIENLSDSIIAAAQAVYDDWDQDDEGWSDHFGHEGGICDAIAEAICDSLIKAGIDSFTISASVGEQHVWSIAIDREKKEAVSVDISPYVYETGGGYVWKKRQGVVFDKNVLQIQKENYDDILLAEEEWE